MNYWYFLVDTGLERRDDWVVAYKRVVAVCAHMILSFVVCNIILKISLRKLL